MRQRARGTPVPKHQEPWDAPYTSGRSLISSISQTLDALLEQPVGIEGFTALGMTVHVARQVHRAFVVLGLLSEDSTWTPLFERLRKASPAQRTALLKAIILDVYAPVFEKIGPPPVVASRSQLLAAFSSAEPRSQRHRMIFTFTALCRYVGFLELDLDDAVNRQAFRINIGRHTVITAEITTNRSALSPGEALLLDSLTAQLLAMQRGAATTRRRSPAASAEGSGKPVPIRAATG